jgi:beta-glucosidase
VTGGLWGTAGAASFKSYCYTTETCLVFINAWSGEGGDRLKLSDNRQDGMVNTVASYCNNTIVVANVAGPRILDAWIENENVTAVIYSGYLGQDSGNAIADMLYGDVNPSGKLTYTIAMNETQYPTQICKTLECDFTEGVFIDYRYLDATICLSGIPLVMA